MDLRPLSYEEMCQVELLHAAASAAAVNNKVGSVGNVVSANGSQTTMLPIMVIPTSMMPPGTIITTSNSGGGCGGGGGGVGTSVTTPVISSIDGTLCEHQFYQLQPAHILAATAAAAAAAAAQQASSTPPQNAFNSFVGGEDNISLSSTTTTPSTANAVLLPTMVSATTASPSPIGEQHPQQQQLQQQYSLQQQQQIPQTMPGTASPATVNILYAGTLNKPNHQIGKPTPTTLTSLLTRKVLEAATLPRGFQTNAYHSNASGGGDGTPTHAGGTEESDFEGSECGASISTTTCIPPFRFGGCGMILQPSAMQHQHQQQHQNQHQHQHQQQHQPVIGCGAFTHMMGSFAAAAGGAMHAGRLAGVGAGFTNTLGRNRRTTTSSDGTTQTPKRVSFKADTMPPLTPPAPPPPVMDDMHHQMHEFDPSGIGVGIGGRAGADGCSNDGSIAGLRISHHSQLTTSTPPPPPLDAFHNCSYVHFDNFMDYQTTGFGGLPDVTEHSNIRRTLSRQNSISNSDSGGEIASIQKSKVNFGDQIKSPTSSGGAGGDIDVGGGTVGGGISAAAKRRKSKAAQHHGELSGAIVQGYKTRRGSYAIVLTLVAALCLLAIAALLAYQHFFMTPSRNSHTQRLRIVRRILREVPLVDGHNNFAWNVRKYAHSSLELVHVHHDLDQKTLWTRPTWAQTDMERLKQGLVGVQVWSAYVPCEAQGLDAVQLALEQIDIIRRLADMYGSETVLVTSSQDIAAARRHGLMASLIGIEGGHAIGSSLGVLRSFYSLGARYLSLTHRCDVSWASSSVSSLESHGLTQFGKAIVREMNRLGMMIDLSYSSDATARDVLLVTRAPVIFSHSAARQLCNSTRNIPDDILRLVAENGGLIMVSFDSEDVACGSGSGRQARLKDVIDHIKYIRSIAGIQHIGLGAGYDGIEMPPIGLEDVSKYPDLLATLLEDPNWSEEDIAMLAGKNFLRIMETVENVRDYWKRAAIQPIEQTEPQPKSQCTYMSS